MSTIVKAAAVQISPVLYSREGTVAKVVQKIHELGLQGVQFAFISKARSTSGTRCKTARGWRSFNPAAAHEMLEKLPLGQAHMMRFELIPLGPLNPLRKLPGMSAQAQ